MGKTENLTAGLWNTQLDDNKIAFVNGKSGIEIIVVKEDAASRIKVLGLFTKGARYNVVIRNGKEIRIQVDDKDLDRVKAWLETIAKNLSGSDFALATIKKRKRGALTSSVIQLSISIIIIMIGSVYFEGIQRIIDLAFGLAVFLSGIGSIISYNKLSASHPTSTQHGNLNQGDPS